ncbi:MAG: BatD family protein, partial [Proteobacteria bacterium]|nr:BatD family protein [Pseudomonadota bacterium]
MNSLVNQGSQGSQAHKLAGLCAGLLLMICSQAWSIITASVDPATVDEMETVMFTLRVAGSNQAEEIDLSPLDNDFEVLGTNTSSQFRSINGRVQSWVEYQISLRPKRTGVLEIPPLSTAGETSEPVEIRVNPLDPDVRASIERMIFFETEVSEDPVYVQAQTILTRRLYYSGGVQIYSDLPDMPDLTNAVVISMGDMRSSTEFRDGERYGVLEQRFAIFPEHSGDLVIPQISVTSSIRLQSRGRLRRSGVRVSTDELVLKVLPIPPEYPADQPWLPATDVTISETWDPDRTAFEVGEPISRTLSVNVQANSASSISPVEVLADDTYFKQYPEPETLIDDLSDAFV